MLHIISHTDLDGVVSAALAWHAHNAGGVPIRLSLTGYGEVDTLIVESWRAASRMVVLDLSPQFQATVDEIDRTCSPDAPPFLFDHHKSTQEKYANRSWLVVDTGYCGAHVYWNWLHAGGAGADTLGRIAPLREIVRIANDRDLWINQDPDGRLWQAMVTICGEWGALARLIANPDAALSPCERTTAENFVARQEERFKRASEHLVRSRIGGSDRREEMAFLGDGHLEFGDTSDFCGMILDRPENPQNVPALVALAYRKPGGNWAVSLRSRNGLAGRVISLLKDGRKIRGGGHGDAAALYFPAHYNEEGIRTSIIAALETNNESNASMGVTLGDMLKGAL